jgi:peptidoglycan hydrolase-like protein with peptidoglycan-binding domain
MVHKISKAAVFCCLSLVLVAMITTPQAVIAQTTNTDTAALNQQVQAQIQSLQTQINTLNAQRGELRQDLADVRKELRLQMREGAEGEEVKTLQEFLSQFPDIYPEGKVTGYYGMLTKRAVQKFQKKHGIDQLGEVGPKTRAKINDLIHGSLMGAGTSGNMPPGIMKKTFPEYTNENHTFNIGNGSTTTHPGQKKGLEKVVLCHKPGTPAAQSLRVTAPAAPAHLNHGDRLGTCAPGDIPKDDGAASTTPDTTAPLLSAITATSTSSTTATISWVTNESSNSSVTYGTTSPIATAASTAITTNSTLVMNHTMPLSDLMASTTYYYLVRSKDAAGNTATSSEYSFMTTTLP